MDGRSVEKKVFTGRSFSSSEKILACPSSAEKQKLALPIGTSLWLRDNCRVDIKTCWSGKNIQRNTNIPTSPWIFSSLQLLSIYTWGLGDHHHGRMLLKKITDCSVRTEWFCQPEFKEVPSVIAIILVLPLPVSHIHTYPERLCIGQV